MDKDLAEFIGIFIGDGSLYVRKEKHSYEFKFTGNPKDEFPYYAHVSNLASKILKRNIKTKRLDGGTTVGLYFCSKKLYEKFKSIGLKEGPKSHTIRIPKIILESPDFLIPCLRGIFDTDGCLTLKRRGKIKPYYPVITFGMASKALICEISVILDNWCIPHTKSLDITNFDKRTRRIYTINYLSINGKNNVNKWFSLIGTSNPKIKQKYNSIK